MEFKYSEPIDSASYETHGLCNGVPLRRHRDLESERRGAIRAQEDWSKLVHPVVNYHGGLGPAYTFMCVTVPECLPERLEIISYANEFAFLYDDVMENISFKQDSVENGGLLGVFGKDLLSDKVEGAVRGEKRIQAQILSEMMAIDPERAQTSMKAWARFIELSSARERYEPFSTLEEYLPYRIIDAGEMIWFGAVTFGMALTIPEEELALCSKLVRPGFAALSLTNDLYSWEKELAAAKNEGLEHVVNGIWVIMQEQSVSEKEAKTICRAKIIGYVADFLRVVEDTKVNYNISEDLRIYVEAIMYSLSGNLVWSIYCPRYHE